MYTQQKLTGIGKKKPELFEVSLGNKKEDALKALEAGAKAAKRGLWADKNAIPPWEWRKIERGRRKK